MDSCARGESGRPNGGPDVSLPTVGRGGIAKRRVIAVADDDPAIRGLLTAVFEAELGAHVLVAEHGQRLLDLVREVRPDLIVLDVTMPVMGGLEAARCLLADARTADVPLIAISADAQRAAVLESGCCAFVAKPFELAELLSIVRQQLSAGEAS